MDHLSLCSGSKIFINASYIFEDLFLKFLSRKISEGLVKFIYSEKATKFCEIYPLLLTVCTVVKSKGKISQNFVAFSKYMNFKMFHCAPSCRGMRAQRNPHLPRPQLILLTYKCRPPTHSTYTTTTTSYWSAQAISDSRLCHRTTKRRGPFNLAEVF